MAFVSGPNTKIINPRWWTAAILKNYHNYLGRGSSNFDEIWHSEAVRRSTQSQFKEPVAANDMLQNIKLCAIYGEHEHSTSLSYSLFNTLLYNICFVNYICVCIYAYTVFYHIFGK